jgi:RimJ/RimL family protein N-acetyltransferase
MPIMPASTKQQMTAIKMTAPTPADEMRGNRNPRDLRRSVSPGTFDPQLFAHVDHPNGSIRFSYVKLDNTTVIAFVEFVRVDFVQGAPCFQIGYAVPARYRNQGRAKDAVAAAIRELEFGLTRNSVSPFLQRPFGARQNAARTILEP